MKKFLIIIITLLTCSMSSISPAHSISNPSSGSTQINFIQSMGDALENAQKTDQFIFVSFFTHWCKPCKWQEQNTFTNSQVIEHINANYIGVKLDAMVNHEVLEKYDIQNYPTLALLSPAGKLLFKSDGALSVDQLLQVVHIFNELKENQGLADLDNTEQ